MSNRVTNIIHHTFGHNSVTFIKTGKEIVEQAARLASELESHLNTREERIRAFLTTKLDNLIDPSKFIAMLREGSVKAAVELAAHYSSASNSKVAASELDGFDSEVTNYNTDRNVIARLRLITRNLKADDTVYKLSMGDLDVLEF